MQRKNNSPGLLPIEGQLRILPAMGRPRKEYEPEWADMLIKHCEEGLSIESFAGKIGVAKSTLYELFERFPDFANAQKEAIAKSQLWWERMGVLIVKDDVDALIKEHKLQPFLKERSTRTFRDGSTETTTKYHVPRPDVVGWIFNMKNRFGWRDIKEQEVDDRLSDLARLLGQTLVHAATACAIPPDNTAVPA